MTYLGQKLFSQDAAYPNASGKVRCCVSRSEVNPLLFDLHLQTTWTNVNDPIVAIDLHQIEIDPMTAAAHVRINAHPFAQLLGISRLQNPAAGNTSPLRVALRLSRARARQMLNGEYRVVIKTEHHPTRLLA